MFIEFSVQQNLKKYSSVIKESKMNVSICSLYPTIHIPEKTKTTPVMLILLLQKLYLPPSKIYFKPSVALHVGGLQPFLMLNDG